MNSASPRLDVIGVAFTLVGTIAGFTISILGISDPLLRLLGIVIVFISIALFVLIYWKFRASKEITYHIISITKVLSVVESPEVKGRVQILLDNKPVRDVHVVVVRIWNTGSLPIERKDYDNNRPILFDFGEEAEVLEAEVVKASTPSLMKEATASLKWNDKSVMLEPLLLNKKTSLKIKFLITKIKDSQEIKLDNAGLIGVNIRNWEYTIDAKIDRLYKSRNPLITTLLGFLGGVVFIFIFSLFLTASTDVISYFLGVRFINNNQTPNVYWYILFVTEFVILICMIIYISKIIDQKIEKEDQT
jgi:hypothetical protein